MRIGPPSSSTRCTSSPSDEASRSLRTIGRRTVWPSTRATARRAAPSVRTRSPATGLPPSRRSISSTGTSRRPSSTAPESRAGDQLGLDRERVPSQLAENARELGRRMIAARARNPVHDKPAGVTPQHPGDAVGKRLRLAQTCDCRHWASTSSVCSPKPGIARRGGVTTPSTLNSEPSNFTSPTPGCSMLWTSPLALTCSCS